jgi:hypothetical protein
MQLLINPVETKPHFLPGHCMPCNSTLQWLRAMPWLATWARVDLYRRPEVAAQPGQVLIDQATYTARADQIVADPLEPILVKGKAQPVVVFNLKGLK